MLYNMVYKNKSIIEFYGKKGITFMRKLLCAMLILALLAVPVFALSVSAESAVDEDVIISDLIPDTVDGNFEATNCDVVINKDGSMTVTITGDAPTLKIKLAEGTLLYTGADVDVNEPAYVAVDFGAAGDVVVSHMILHYTRKDKDAVGTFADLYLQSMYSSEYAAYQKQTDGAAYDSSNYFVNGSSHYVVWDWGTYVASSDAKVFDDGMHHFVDLDIAFGTNDGTTQKSAIGSQVTFYTIAVVSDPEVELGTVTPDPITPADDDPTDPETSEGDDPETSEGDDPETSDVASEDSTDEESSTATDDESTSAPEDGEPNDTASDTTSGTTSGATSDSSNASDNTDNADGEDGEGDEGGLGTGAIVGIIVAVVVVIGGVVAGVVVAKKKK